MSSDNVSLHFARRLCQVAKSPCMLREGFAALQSVPACCEKVLQRCKVSLHAARRFCSVAKCPCMLREGFAALQSVPACCEEVLQRCKVSLHAARRFCSTAKCPCMLREAFVLKRNLFKMDFTARGRKQLIFINLKPTRL